MKWSRILIFPMIFAIQMFEYFLTKEYYGWMISFGIVAAFLINIRDNTIKMEIRNEVRSST